MMTSGEKIEDRMNAKELKDMLNGEL